MSENQKKILEFIIVISSFFLIIFLWNKINLVYINEQNVIGVTYFEKFNPLNNDLRLFILISFVALTYYLFLRNVYKDQNTILEVLKLKNFKTKNLKDGNSLIGIFFLVILSGLLIEFLTTDLPRQNLDFFHEGEWLAPSYHLKIADEKITNIFFIHGVFYDLLQPLIAWDIFGKISIGSVRLFNLILILITKILLLILIYKISINQDLTKFGKFIIFLCLNIICFKLIRYDQNVYNYFTFRDIPIILILIFSLDILKNSSASNFYGFVIGALSFASLFFTIDRGIYCLFLAGIIIIFLMINKKYWKLISVIIGFVASITFFLIFFQPDQLKIIFENALQILTIKPLLDNYIFPTPIL